MKKSKETACIYPKKYFNEKNTYMHIVLKTLGQSVFKDIH